MKKRQAFTLIELLAVIVVLTIIAIIVTPMIIGTINSAKENIMKASAQNYASAVDDYIAAVIAKGGTFEDKTYNVTDTELAKVEVSGKKPTSGTIVISNGQVVSYDLVIDTIDVFKDANTESVVVKPKVNEETITPGGSYNPDDAENQFNNSIDLSSKVVCAGGLNSGDTSIIWDSIYNTVDCQSIYNVLSVKQSSYEKNASSDDNGYIGVSLVKSGYALLSSVCKNIDQKPGPVMPKQFCLNYEILLPTGSGNEKEFDSGHATFENGGDSEIIIIKIDSEIIKSQGYLIAKVVSIKFKDVLIGALGQKLSLNIYLSE